jgi:UPF0755 protein
MKKLTLLTILIMLLTMGCSKNELVEKFTGPVDPDDTTIIEMVIPNGTSTDGIADLLVENNLILNKLAFKELAKSMDADTSFKAGTYHLNKGMDAAEIIEIIAGGNVYLETTMFTIPEGFELNQIINRLVSLELADEETLLAVLKNDEFDYKFMDYIDRDQMLEGFLYPDTYEIKKGATAHEIIDKMLRKFDLVFLDEYYGQLEELDMTMNELITLASIIEREAKLDVERATISSVFHNRLDIDMKLQSCATIQYALGERKEALTYADLEVDSPYNTYQLLGLPPAPIASPGEKSIVAALYPEETNFLFFVTKETEDGSHYFNETLEGHNNDKNKK